MPSSGPRGKSNMAAGLAAGQEVTRRAWACRDACEMTKKKRSHRQTRRASGLLSPRTRAELKGVKVHQRQKRKVGEAVMQKSDMWTGREMRVGLARAKVTEDK
ncbi:hypothetical protein PBY51_019721 [Eleginops maclovinus]|uniref:Uncharacterized protein n=1 Tax=Eleginops maclovinus TaxID=56733 RepID=A0AAN8AMI5_ELEMC|nr:hypothetical protein PBY51_019721 [Eleginops maclovinus]